MLSVKTWPLSRLEEESAHASKRVILRLISSIASPPYEEAVAREYAERLRTMSQSAQRGSYQRVTHQLNALMAVEMDKPGTRERLTAKMASSRGAPTNPEQQRAAAALVQRMKARKAYLGC